MSRSIRSQILACLFAGSLPALMSASAAFGASPPNLLLFLADDMTYTDLGCYGNPDVKTPHIDRLAAEGIRFEQFYVNSPICSPSRNRGRGVKADWSTNVL